MEGIVTEQLGHTPPPHPRSSSGLTSGMAPGKFSDDDSAGSSSSSCCSNSSSCSIVAVILAAVVVVAL